MNNIAPIKQMNNLQKNIPKLYAFSFLQMTLFPMAIITIFWKEHIGLSLTQILLLQGILSIVMVIMEYPSGYLSDRVGYKIALSTASAFGIIGWGLYTVASTFYGVLMAEIVIGISLAFISGSDSALLFETLKTAGNEADYARYQGRMSGFAQGGESFGAIFAGIIYAWQPTAPFYLQILVWIMALLLTRTISEPPRQTIRPLSHLLEALHSIRYTFVENRRLRSIIILNTALGIASFYPVWLIQPYMKHAGVPLTWFGPIWGGANLCVAIASLASHRVNAYMGNRSAIILFSILTWFGYLGLGLTGAIWSFLFYYLLTIMRGLRGPMMLASTHAETPSSHRAGILSLQSLTFRLAFAITGPIIGGWGDRYGVQSSFLFLFFGFLILLPPLTFNYLKNINFHNSI